MAKYKTYRDKYGRELQLDISTGEVKPYTPPYTNERGQVQGLDLATGEVTSSKPMPVPAASAQTIGGYSQFTADDGASVWWDTNKGQEWKGDGAPPENERYTSVQPPQQSGRAEIPGESAPQMMSSASTQDALSRLHKPKTAIPSEVVFASPEGRTVVDATNGTAVKLGQGDINGPAMGYLADQDAVAQRDQLGAQGAVEDANATRQERLRLNPQQTLPNADGSPAQDPQALQEAQKISQQPQNVQDLSQGQSFRLRQSGSPLPTENIQNMEDLAGRYGDNALNVRNLQDQLVSKQSQVDLYEAHKQAKFLEFEAEHAQGLEKATKEYQDTVKLNADNYQRRMETAKADRENAYNTFANMRINPDQFWADRGTGGRVAGAIAVALGAFGSSLNGAPNYAMQIIESAIDNDMRAQQENMRAAEAKVGMANHRYEMVRQSYADEMDQANINKAAAYAAIKAQLDTAKAQYGITENTQFGTAFQNISNMLDVKQIELEIDYMKSYGAPLMDQLNMQNMIAERKQQKQLFELEWTKEMNKAGVVGEVNVVAAPDFTIGGAGATPVMVDTGNGVFAPAVVKDKDRELAAGDIRTINALHMNIKQLLEARANPKATPAQVKAIASKIGILIARTATENLGTLDQGVLDFADKVSGKDWLSFGKFITDAEINNLVEAYQDSRAILVSNLRTRNLELNPKLDKFWQADLDAVAQNYTQVLRNEGKIPAPLPGQFKLQLPDLGGAMTFSTSDAFSPRGK